MKDRPDLQVAVGCQKPSVNNRLRIWIFTASDTNLLSRPSQAIGSGFLSIMGTCDATSGHDHNTCFEGFAEKLKLLVFASARWHITQKVWHFSFSPIKKLRGPLLLVERRRTYSSANMNLRFDSVPLPKQAGRKFSELASAYERKIALQHAIRTHCAFSMIIGNTWQLSFQTGSWPLSVEVIYRLSD